MALSIAIATGGSGRREPGTGGGSLGGRHRALCAVVDSSFMLLDQDDRPSFDVLAVFADWFDLAAAREVAPNGRAGRLR